MSAPEPDTEGGTEQEIRDKLFVKKIECKNCGTQPVAGWKDGSIQLLCECGGRELPDDAVLNHDWMPDNVEWTVIDE